MVIHLLAGGPRSLVPELIDSEDITWVGVDRGVYELLNRNIRPSCAFGDFDSLSEAEKETLRSKTDIFTFPREKDKTDLELALDWALTQRPRSIRIFGATGGRLDHEWANIRLLGKRLDGGTEVTIIDRHNMIFVRRPGCYEISRDVRYPYISFLPFYESIIGLTLEGFKYPLFEVDVHPGSTLTVSNEIVADSGTYSFTAGIGLVVRSHDPSSVKE